MAASQSTRRGRPAQSKPKRVERVADRIGIERRRLNKAAAVLIGAELTAEYCPEMSLVTDAIGVARELVEQTISALDTVELARAGTERGVAS